MSLSLSKFRRSITISGFGGDADPNTSAPSAEKIFSLDTRDRNGSVLDGHILVGKFNTNETAGTAVFVTWFRDDAEGDWYRFTQDTLTHRVGKVSKSLQSADLFIQVLSFADTGAATTFTLSVVEL